MKAYTNLVHDGDASILGGLVELEHGGGDVAGSDDMLLLADSRLDDGSVESVGDQADDEVVLGDFGVKGLVVVDIEGNSLGELDAVSEGLGGLDVSASCNLLAE